MRIHILGCWGLMIDGEVRFLAYKYLVVLHIACIEYILSPREPSILTLVPLNIRIRYVIERHIVYVKYRATDIRKYPKRSDSATMFLGTMEYSTADQSYLAILNLIADSNHMQSLEICPI